MKTIYLIKFEEYAIGKEFESVNEPRHEIIVGTYEDLLTHCNTNISESDWDDFLSPLEEVGSVNVWLDRRKNPTEDEPESYDGYVSINTDLNIQVVTVEDLKRLKEEYVMKVELIEEAGYKAAIHGLSLSYGQSFEKKRSVYLVECKYTPYLPQEK
jgi:hypothetical protein